MNIMSKKGSAELAKLEKLVRLDHIEFDGKEHIQLDKLIKKLDKMGVRWGHMITDKLFSTERVNESHINVSKKVLLTDPSIEKKTPKETVGGAVLNAVNGRWNCYYHTWVGSTPNIFVARHASFDTADDLIREKVKFDRLKTIVYSSSSWMMLQEYDTFPETGYDIQQLESKMCRDDDDGRICYMSASTSDSYIIRCSAILEPEIGLFNVDVGYHNGKAVMIIVYFDPYIPSVL